MTPDQVKARLADVIAEQRAQLELFAGEIARLREENAQLKAASDGPATTADVAS